MQQHIYIVGAHSRGQTFKEYVTCLYPQTTVEAFLVDDLQENESGIDGIPVKPISAESELNPDYSVYIATRGVYHEKITAELSALGMKQIYPVDVELDSRLRNAYVQKIFAEKNKEFCRMGDEDSARHIHARIYVAASIYDKEPEEHYELLPDERVIQVGAALTEQRIAGAMAFDDQGENISDRNKQFCELTAMYWIWKNAQQDVVGLVHYRRHFLLNENWLEWMHYNHIDVLLPVPLYVAPSIEQNYRNRHDAADWDYMMEYLRQNDPRDYEAAKQFFQSGLYSPCNMFIMRKEVLDDFCGWLFPILDAVVAHGGTKEDPYQNRYPGFLSERLMTYFFEVHRDKYKVAYANKNFLK